MQSTPSFPRYVKSIRCLAVSCLLWLLPLAAAPVLAAGEALTISTPPGLEGDVRFWIRVYTEITTDQGFLHDERNLEVVYGPLRVPQDLPQKERLRIIDQARDGYVATLRALAARPGLARDADTLPTPAEGLAAPWALLGYDPQYAAELSAPAPSGRGSTAVPAASLPPEEQRILALFGPDVTAQRLLDAARTVRFQLGQADRFKAGLVRSGAWEAHIAETLANMGLPPEISALPHVESSFNPAAYSKVGAAGLWQFMRSTGKRYMRVDDAVDERLDPFRSTEAAAQLLAYNYRLLGSWPLAITAYNHGAAGMRRAQDALGSGDYLNINRNFRGATFGFASRNFFPSFLAALTISRNPQRYFGALERAPDARFHELPLPAFVSLAALERATGVSREQLREFNPALRPPVFSGSRLLPRGYRLRVPARLSAWNSSTLEQRLGANELYAAQIVSRTHVVGRGETLAKVARRYGLSAATLAERNGLSAAARVRRGTRLALTDLWPPRQNSAAAAALLAAQSDVPTPAEAELETVVAAAALTAVVPATVARRSYTVRRGDSASSIAARFGLSVAQLLQFNGVRDADYIFEGQQLRLMAPAATATADSTAATPAVPIVPAAPAAAMVANAAATPVVAATVAPTAVTEEVVEQADADDYSISREGFIKVIGAETLGHYAEWLGVSAASLRTLNRLKYGQPVRLGRRLRMDFSHATHSEFERLRRAFHAQLQAEFFEARRIVGTEVYVVRRGDTLWSVTQRYKLLPVWLLQQYNPDADLGDLRAGSQLVVPRVE